MRDYLKARIGSEKVRDAHFAIELLLEKDIVSKNDSLGPNAVHATEEVKNDR